MLYRSELAYLNWLM